MARATKTDKASGKGGSGKGRPKRTTPRNPPRKNARSARKKRGWFSRIADATVMTLRWTIRGLIAIAAAFVLLVALYAFVNPPTTPYIWSETRRLGTVDRQWVDLAEIKPLIIDPNSGLVIGEINLENIFNRKNYNNTIDVMNGIAYNQKNNSLIITGKWWPSMYEIKILN